MTDTPEAPKPFAHTLADFRAKQERDKEYAWNKLLGPDPLRNTARADAGVSALDLDNQFVPYAGATQALFDQQAWRHQEHERSMRYFNLLGAEDFQREPATRWQRFRWILSDDITDAREFAADLLCWLADRVRGWSK